MGIAFDRIRSDALTRLRPLVESRDVKAIGTFQLNFTTAYRDLIADHMRQAYEYGKTGAADELKVPSGGTRRDTTTFINQSAQSIVDKQTSDLLFLVRAEVLTRLRRNQLDDTTDSGPSSTDVIDAIALELATFYERKVALTGPLVVAQALNRGRMDTYLANEGLIYAYQWSSVMDQRTCHVCLALDGSVVTAGMYLASFWEPPIHFRCRCIIIAILRDELNPPEITGFPEMPGGVEAPDL